MKRLLLVLAATLVAVSSFAADDDDQKPTPLPADPKLEKLINESLPVCGDVTISREAMIHKLPPTLTGSVVLVKSPRNACEGQFLTVTTAAGNFYLGVPWFLDELTGTLEEKLKAFPWKMMQENFAPVVDRHQNKDGLYPVVLNQVTEHGPVPLDGLVDPAGTIFFIGHFHPASDDMRAVRLKAFAATMANMPTEGPADAPVTVVEFSDFECPSCQHASGFLKPIMDKHGNKIRYVRFDLPLISNHPWAFTAAVAGHAIYRQKPEVFWEYKKQVYANQDKLSAFTIDDFARGFAQDHELDLKKYDADIVSKDVQNDILKGVGAAFSNDVRATPTYMVNGVFVDPGSDGADLTAYVDKQLK